MSYANIALLLIFVNLGFSQDDLDKSFFKLGKNGKYEYAVISTLPCYKNSSGTICKIVTKLVNTEAATELQYQMVIINEDYIRGIKGRYELRWSTEMLDKLQNIIKIVKKDNRIVSRDEFEKIDSVQ